MISPMAADAGCADPGDGGEGDERLERGAEGCEREHLLELSCGAETVGFGRERIGREDETTLRDAAARDAPAQGREMGTAQRRASTVVQNSSGPLGSMESVLAESSALRKKSVQWRTACGR